MEFCACAGGGGGSEEELVTNLKPKAMCVDLTVGNSIPLPESLSAVKGPFKKALFKRLYGFFGFPKGPPTANLYYSVQALSLSRAFRFNGFSGLYGFHKMIISFF